MVLMPTGSVGGGESWLGVHQSILISRDGTWKENHSLYGSIFNTLRKCIHLDVTSWQQMQQSGKNDSIHSPHSLTACTAWPFLSNTRISYKAGCIARWSQTWHPPPRVSAYTENSCPGSPNRVTFFWMGNPVCQLAPYTWPGKFFLGTTRNQREEGNTTTYYPRVHSPGKGPGAWASGSSVSSG